MALSGEKDPDENLGTVARRHREEVLPGCEDSDHIFDILIPPGSGNAG